MKLSEPQQRVLRTMAEFECALHLSPTTAKAWFGGRRTTKPPYRKVPIRTLLALRRKGLIWEPSPIPWATRNLCLTAKGRALAKELQDDSG